MDREPCPIPGADRDRQVRQLALVIERAAIRYLGQLSVEDESLTTTETAALLTGVLVLQAANVALQSELPLEALQEAVRRAYEGLRDEHPPSQDRPVPGPA